MSKPAVKERVDLILKKAVETALSEHQLLLISDDGFGGSPSVDLFSLVHDEANLRLYPESGVHPRDLSRRRVPDYVKRARESGLVILTYSESLLLGLRLAVSNGLIEPENVVILFVWFNEETGDRCVNRVLVDRRGNLSDWPRGFFDQIEHDLMEIIEWKINRHDDR